ncbi:MAG TPA: Gfo/Idh/MocA family oxidoreductase [Roseiflexaceae bacterium]|nr:Gfo/Idh/MocA family oxidoreductase [Roseiflexaceae bacterium]
MPHPFRLIQIGLGNRGRMWAEIVDSRTDIAHAAVVDPNAAALAEFAATHHDVPTFTQLDDALAAGRYDLALLATPPEGHLAQARQIFAAGLPLLAEKPLTLDLHEAAEIVRLAEHARLPLSVGLNFRFLPVSQKLRELIAAETYGAAGFGQFTYQRNRDGRAPRLNKYPLTMDHPMMLEQSIHHLDLIRFCYGREVEQVDCRTWNPPWSMYAHDSNVHCLLSLEGGVEVNYFGTWTGGWDELQFQWRTDCADGVIVQRQLFDDLAAARTGDPALTPIDIAPARAFYDDTDALLSAFLAALRAGTPVPCAGRDHLHTLALCFAAIESSQTRRTVELTDFYRRTGLAVLL